MYIGVSLKWYHIFLKQNILKITTEPILETKLVSEFAKTVQMERRISI